MKLGMLDLVPVLGNIEGAEALAQAARLAQAGERLGYSRYWAAEHHDMPQLACPAPEVLLAHIGARTSRIRLGTGALLLPHYKPLKVAETFHLLASLYPGRIDLGIGRAPGGSAHATMALSDNFLAQVHRLPEALRALSELLTFRYRVEGELVTARPVPPAPPELWLLGTNRKSAAYAAEIGAGYVFGQFMSDEDGADMLAAYRRDFRPSALMSEPRSMLAIGVVCADTEAEAAAWASEGRAAWGRPAPSPGAGVEAKPGAETDARHDADAEPDRRLESAFVGGPHAAKDTEHEAAPDAASDTRHDAASDAEPGQAARQPRQLTGTAAQVKERLADLAAACKADELLVVTHVTDYEKRLRSYALLAEACGLNAVEG